MLNQLVKQEENFLGGETEQGKVVKNCLPFMLLLTLVGRILKLLFVDKIVKGHGKNETSPSISDQACVYQVSCKTVSLITYLFIHSY